MNLSAVLFVVVAGFFSGGASASDLAIKGVKPGDSIASTCGPIEPVDASGASIKDEVAAFKVYDIKRCSGSISTYAGTSLSEPSDMLFMDGKLIAVRLDLAPVDMGQLANIIGATQGLFWKVKPVTRNGVTTYLWTKNGDELVVERVSPSWDDNRLTIHLRNKKNFSLYLRRHDENARAIKAAEIDRAKQDLQR